MKRRDSTTASPNNLFDRRASDQTPYPYVMNIGERTVSFEPGTWISDELKFILDQPKQEGIVIKLFLRDNERYGFICPENCNRDNPQENVYFSFSCVKNRSDESVLLGVDTWVRFVLNKKAQVPKAFMVFIGDDGWTKASLDRNVLVQLGCGKWLQGKIVTVSKSEKSYFVLAPSEVRVKIHKAKISRLALDLKKGDRLDFVLADHGGNKREPFAKKARISEYIVERSDEELRTYFTDVSNDHLNGDGVVLVLPELLTLDAIWNFFAQSTFSRDLFLDFLDFLTLLMYKSRTFHHEDLLTLVLQTLTSGTLFKRIPEIKQPKENAVLFRFCKLALAVAPDLVKTIKPLVNHILNVSLENHRDKGMICELFDTFARASNPDWTDGSRSSKTVIPSAAEFLGNGLDEDHHLSKVKLDGPYASAVDYMDCYYGVLRAETFSKIQQGVKDFINCQLDYRDMYIYTNIAMVGISTEGHEVSIALKFQVNNKYLNFFQLSSCFLHLYIYYPIFCRYLILQVRKIELSANKRYRGMYLHILCTEIFSASRPHKCLTMPSGQLFMIGTSTV